MRQRTVWLVVVAANVAAWCMLGFYGTIGAAPQNAAPFRNAVEQREEMIRELREIKTLLREQTTLLRQLAAKQPPS